MVEKILFVCTHNAARSPMAEAMLRAALEESGGIEALSAGLAGETLSPFAILAMQEAGIDISDHEPREMYDLDLAVFDTVVALSRNAFEYLREQPGVGALEYWDVTKPPALGETSREAALETFRRIREEISAHIRNRFDIPVGKSFKTP